jgi:hypothetical protein
MGEKKAPKKKPSKADQQELEGTSVKPTGPILKAVTVYEERREENATAKEEFRQAKEALIKLMRAKGVVHMKGNGWEITVTAKDTVRVKNLEEEKQE